MKTLSIIALALITCHFGFFNIDGAGLSGRWYRSKPGSAFTLDLRQSGSTLRGSHCSVQLNGRRIDCGVDLTKITLRGTISNRQTATVTFTSGYCNKTGRATIRKINARQIEWKITKPPGGEYYIPDIDTLTKE